MQVSMTVNGEQVTREIEGRMLLVHFLRDELGLTGTHWGCDTSNCGTCVAWMDGEPVKTCTVLAAMAGGREVRTVEGLEQDGVLDPIQEGFMQCHGLQCGFCTPGMLMTCPRPPRQGPGPERADHPRGHLRADLPLHRLHHDRPVGAVGRAAREGPAPARRRAGHDRGEPVMTVTEPAGTVETAEDLEHADNDKKPCGHGRMLRKEDPRFIRGRGRYVDDVQLPGMLHLAILRSPVAHARITGIDTTAAESHPKVKARRHRRRCSPRRAWPGCRPCPTTCRPCWPPTRSASRARRSPSSSPRTGTPPATPSS